MPEYVFLMHGDTTSPEIMADWEKYISRLQSEGRFKGGSAIGKGHSFRKSGTAAETAPVTGFIRVAASSFVSAQSLLAGNPVFEAGGTVEIRVLDEG